MREALGAIRPCHCYRAVLWLAGLFSWPRTQSESDMYFAYVDESGDSGYDGSPSNAFVLSVLLVHEQDWLRALDRLVVMRRYLRDAYGIPPLAELKANHLIQRKGIFKELGISEAERLEVFRLAMKFQRKEGVYTAFSVVIDKTKVLQRDRDPRDFAWQFAIERLVNFSARKEQFVHILPDAGHGYFIRRLVRKMRRFHRVPSAFGPGRLEAAAQRVVEDPSDRHSHESYFIQLADLNAYAALRKVFPTRKLDGSMWDELGEARLEDVNKLAGGPPGIKVFPK